MNADRTASIVVTAIVVGLALFVLCVIAAAGFIVLRAASLA